MKAARLNPLARSFRFSLVLALVAAACSRDASPVVEARFAATTTGLTSVSAAEPATGFPLWYGDGAGVRLTPCVSPAEPCVVGSTVPDPTRPPSVPANYPGEGFYFDAVSRLNVNGGGRATLTLAIETAFGNAAGSVASGDQITFQRINLKVTGGLVPGQTYTITHPYGVDKVVADASGAITTKVAGSRVQLGCGATPPACDFSLALGGRIGPFLRRDPADLNAPPTPAGFLGDGVNTHRVLGSPFGTNLFKISGKDAGGPGTSSVSTDQFTVAGKIAGPLVALPASISFGSQATATTGAAQTLVITNVGGDVVTVTSASVATTEFAVQRNGCTAPLARDANCTIDVAFSPTTSGARLDALTIAGTTSAGAIHPVVVPLDGAGAAAATAPAVAFSTTSVTFGDQPVGQLSPRTTVTVTNTGTAALHVFSASLSGTNPADFLLTANSCSVVAPAASCAVDVTFSPIADGARSALLSFNDDAAGSPQAISLSGIGHAGLVAAGVSDADIGFPRFYQDSSGTRLELCLDPTQPCVAGSTVPDPTQPPSVPANFPAEGFYFDAVSSLTVGGTGKATLTLALEGAFGNAAGAVATGDQITFQRVDLRVTGGLVPGETYTVKHPYGVDSVVADASGAISVRVPGARTQVGCGLVPPACDFGFALRGRLGPFLARAADDVTGTPTPPGFIGDGVSLHRVMGSPLGTNFFSISGKDAGGPGVATVTTDQFTLAGKLAGPLVSAARTIDFGAQSVGATATSRNVTFTNLGANPLTVTGVAVTGAASGDFTIAASPASSCLGATLARDATCTVAVVFAPQIPGPRNAALAIAHDGLRSPLAVGLSGTATLSQGAPAVALSPVALSFTTQAVGVVSAAQRVTVTNTGTANLAIASVARGGVDAVDFANDGGCANANLAPSASCVVNVTFAAASVGAKSATLVFTDNAPDSPQTVPITGAAQTDNTPPTAAVTASGGFISPNGDGRADTLTVSGTFSEPTSWTWRVVNNNVNPAVTLALVTGTGTTITATWDGRASGRVVANGTYQWQLTGSDAAGNPLSSLSGTVVVDTSSPTVSSVVATPARFSPSQGQVTSIAVQVSEAGTVTLTIVTGRTTVRTLTGTLSAAGTVAIVWDGRTSTGTLASPATYNVTAVAADRAQNQSGSRSTAVSVAP
jgi:Abnormal spindle-like microcephaly-assoc'd, ASPM-SPD-2-Hydin/FlgD Ig-like domain